MSPPRATLYRASAAVTILALPGLMALRLAAGGDGTGSDPMQIAMEDLAIALAASERLSGTGGGPEAGLARRLAAQVPADPERAWLRRVVAAEAGLPAPASPAEAPEGARAILALYEEHPAAPSPADLTRDLGRLVPYPFLRLLIDTRAQRLAGLHATAREREAVARRAAAAMVARTVAISSYFLLMLVCGVAVVLAAVLGRAATATADPSPSPGDALGVFAAWMAMHLAGSLPLGVVAAAAPGHLGLLWLAAGYVATGAIALAMARAWVARPSGMGLARLLGLSTAPGLALAGALSLPAAVPLMLAAFGLSRLVPLPQGPSENPVLGALLEGGTGLRIAMALLVGVVAPVVEESIFRGLLFPALRHLAGMPVAVAATGLVFGLAHLDPPAILPLWALGSLLSYLRHRTGSVLPCMVTHGLWNLQTFVVVLLLVPPVG